MAKNQTSKNGPKDLLEIVSDLEKRVQILEELAGIGTGIQTDSENPPPPPPPPPR